MAYLARTNSNLDYDLIWHALEAGEKVAVFEGQNDRYVETFPTTHTRGEKSLGYNIIENRRRLKLKYQKLSEKKIQELVREKGREEITTTYPQKLFSYGGDSAPLDPDHVRDTEILCHEATFLNEQDRETITHSTLEEAIKVAREAGVKRELYAFHISSRYRKELKQIGAEVEKLKLDFTIHLVPPGRICRYE